MASPVPQELSGKLNFYYLPQVHWFNDLMNLVWSWSLFIVVLAKLLQTKSLTEEKLSLKCDDKLFLELSSQIPHSGLTLALSLGLTDADEGQIKRDKDNERERIIATLVKWKKKNGDDATYLALVMIFMQCQNRELAEFILDYFNNSH